MDTKAGAKFFKPAALLMKANTNERVDLSRAAYLQENDVPENP